MGAISKICFSLQAAVYRKGKERERKEKPSVSVCTKRCFQTGIMQLWEVFTMGSVVPAVMLSSPAASAGAQVGLGTLGISTGHPGEHKPYPCVSLCSCSREDSLKHLPWTLQPVLLRCSYVQMLGCTGMGKGAMVKCKVQKMGTVRC